MKTISLDIFHDDNYCKISEIYGSYYSGKRITAVKDFQFVKNEKPFVTAKMIECIKTFFNRPINFLSMPKDGRELLQIDEGIGININGSYSVDYDEDAYFEMSSILNSNFPGMRRDFGDINDIVYELDYLPEVAHLDYYGALSKRSRAAAEYLVSRGVLTFITFQHKRGRWKVNNYIVDPDINDYVIFDKVYKGNKVQMRTIGYFNPDVKEEDIMCNYNKKTVGKLTGYTRSWNKLFNIYLLYAKKFGPRFMFVSKLESDPMKEKIYYWMISQRYNFNRNDLSKRRENKLKKAGFVFDIHQDHWEQRFLVLKEVSNKIRNEGVNAKFVELSSITFRTWYKKTRVEFLNKNLSKKKIKLLKSISFNGGKDTIVSYLLKCRIEYLRKIINKEIDVTFLYSNLDPEKRDSWASWFWRMEGIYFNPNIKRKPRDLKDFHFKRELLKKVGFHEWYRDYVKLIKRSRSSSLFTKKNGIPLKIAENMIKDFDNGMAIIDVSKKYKIPEEKTRLTVKKINCYYDVIKAISLGGKLIEKHQNVKPNKSA